MVSMSSSAGVPGTLQLPGFPDGSAIRGFRNSSRLRGQGGGCRRIPAHPCALRERADIAARIVGRDIHAVHQRPDVERQTIFCRYRVQRRIARLVAGMGAAAAYTSGCSPAGCSVQRHPAGAWGAHRAWFQPVASSRHATKLPFKSLPNSTISPAASPATELAWGAASAMPVTGRPCLAAMASRAAPAVSRQSEPCFR